MPFAPASDGVRLYYEETGTGHPIVFVHEFASDLRQWETQVRFFSREYRCITYNARGYPPSDVPTEAAHYGQDAATDDIASVMKYLGISKAHIVGLSMGGFATLRFGLKHPDMASALVVAGCGGGSIPGQLDVWRKLQHDKSDRLDSVGFSVVARETAEGPSRVRLRQKDPRGWQEFVSHLEEHSVVGSSLTQRRYQGGRDPVQAWEADLKMMNVPTLLVIGDEDENCFPANIFLKKTLPNAGLWIYPRTGHAINLEEPAAFNGIVAGFFSSVERGRWLPK